MSWGHVVVGVVSAVLVLVGTVVSARWQARVGTQANRTADWDSYGQRMNELQEQMEQWTNLQLEERDRRIDRLERRLEIIESKYRQAVAYIRRLVTQLRTHVEPDRIEKPPDEIVPDL